MLVAQIKFTEWTTDDSFFKPFFVRLRMIPEAAIESGECWGFPFFSLSAARFIPHPHPHSQRLLLYFPSATIQVIGGAKVLEFLEELSNHRATGLKSDGKEILEVKVMLNGGDRERVNQDIRTKKTWHES